VAFAVQISSNVKVRTQEKVSSAFNCAKLTNPTLNEISDRMKYVIQFDLSVSTRVFHFTDRKSDHKIIGYCNATWKVCTCIYWEVMKGLFFFFNWYFETLRQETCVLQGFLELCGYPWTLE